MKESVWSGIALALLLTFCQAASAQSAIVSTYAGPPLPVTGTSALAQTIDLPSAAVQDGAGGFYVASELQNKVYRVAPNGTLSIIADGLASPQALAVDASGNLFISDTRNNRILKVTTAGQIRTIAGTGGTAYGGDSGAATSAQFYHPTGLAFDGAGNLFVADTGNNRIRKITPGGVVTTVAGNGISFTAGDGGPAADAQLSAPCGVAADANGVLFIVAGNRIRKVFTPNDSLVPVIITIAGSDSFDYQGDGGPATSASFKSPCGITMDAIGNLFIADSFNNRIRKITSAGMITSVAGDGTFDYGGDGGPSVSAKLHRPTSVSVDASGHLLIADTQNHRVRKAVPGGTIVTVAGNGRDGFSGDGGSASSARFNAPTGIAVDASGNIFIADRDNNRIRKVTPAGIISTIAGNSVAGFSGDGGMATAALLNAPESVAVDSAGNVLIADSRNHRIRKVTSAGIITTVVGDGTPGFGGDGGSAAVARINNPVGLGLDNSGNLFIADRDNHRVRKVTPAGIISTIAGTGDSGFSGDQGPATAAQLGFPEGVSADTAGNLFIADYGNNRIRKVSATGVIVTVAGSGTSVATGSDGAAISFPLRSPRAVAADNQGNFFIAETDTSSIRKVNSAGIISTAAGVGTGARGFSGDGGSAVTAEFNYPSDLTVDGTGNLFVADAFNGRIRKITFIAAPVIVSISQPFGIQGTSVGFSINGTGLANATSVTFSGTGVTAVITGASATDLGVKIQIAAGEIAGVRTVSVTTPTGTSAPFTGFTVLSGPPVITGITPSSGNVGAVVPVTITGTNLVSISGVTLSGTDIITYLGEDATTTTVQATLTILASAPLGARDVRVNTPLGASAPFNGFTITAGPPVITAISPVSGAQGATVFATITGGALSGATHVTVSGSGVTATVNTESNNNILTVTLNIDASAATGIRNITVTTPKGNSIPLRGFIVAPFVPIITTTAGNSPFGGFAGDGDPAALAQFLQPFGVTFDNEGNLFVADSGNNRVRKVTTAGIITTVAGTGASGFSGDNGAATAAELRFPSSAAVDAAGSLFIVDRGNDRIRKVAPSGIITTVAGNGIRGFAGDGGPAASASLARPAGIVLDKMGNLFIADSGNLRVRKVNPQGVISTVAGNGNNGVNPNGSNGDGGPATMAALYGAQGLALDAGGSLFIATLFNVRKVSPSGIISTVAGTAASGGIALDSGGNLYISDTLANRVWKRDPAGTITTIAGGGNSGLFAGDFGAATSASLYSPQGLAIDAFGNLYIAEPDGSRIRKVSFTPIPPPITGVSPSSSHQGSVVSATISGNGLNGVTAITFSGTGVTVTIGTGRTDTSLPVQISIATGAAPDIRTITLKMPTGAPSYAGFAITPGLPRRRSGQVTSQ